MSTFQEDKRNGGSSNNNNSGNDDHRSLGNNGRPQSVPSTPTRDLKRAPSKGIMGMRKGGLPISLKYLGRRRYESKKSKSIGILYRSASRDGETDVSGMINTLNGGQAYREEGFLESLAGYESGLLHLVGSFLLPRELINLAQCSSMICSALKYCRIRLDWTKRTFLLTELENWFARGGRMTQWSLTGVRVRVVGPAREQSSTLWNVLNVGELKKLLLSDVWETFDASPMARCVELESFDAGISCASMENLDKLKKCDALKYLYIRSCNDVQDAEQFIPKTGELVELSLYMCRNMGNIQALQRCTNLKVLDMGGCQSLSDISALKYCRSLEQLSLADCPEIESIEPLQNHPNLYHIDLTGCVGISSFVVLETIVQLKKLALKRCRCSALLSLLSTPREVIHCEATCSMKAVALWLLDPILTDVIALLDDVFDQSDIDRFYEIRDANMEVSTQRNRSDFNYNTQTNLSNDNANQRRNFATAIDSNMSAMEVVQRIERMREPVWLRRRLRLNGNVPRTSNETKCNALQVIAAASAQDTVGQSTVLQQGGLEPILKCMRNGTGKLREYATAALARMSHNRNSVPDITAQGAIPLLVDLVRLDVDNQVLMDTSDSDGSGVDDDDEPMDGNDNDNDNDNDGDGDGGLINRVNKTRKKTGKRAKDLDAEMESLQMTSEYAASALLLIALVEDQRQEIVECNGIQALVQLLENGSDGAAVESAGAIWNLGATLKIGKAIVDSGAVPALIRTLEVRPLAAKVQAAGALRNLSILNENKLKLSKNGIIPVLVRLVRELDVNFDEQRGLLVKILATLRILSSNSTVQVEAADAGAIPPLVNLLLLDFDEPVRRQASGALLALSFNENNRQIIADCGGIGNLIHIVSMDMSDPAVMSAAGCLWNLSMQDSLERKIVQQGAIPALIRRLGSRNIDVVSKVAGALKNLSYQREHKEIVAQHGGVEKLVSLIRDPNSRALPYAVGALRLVASGKPETRTRIVQAGAIQPLVNLLPLLSEQKDSVRLASGTLLHLVDLHAEEILRCGAVPHLIAMTKWRDAPSLVREEACYILQRIAISPNSTDQSKEVEMEDMAMRRSANVPVLKRVRGVPGDTRIEPTNRVTFFSYSSIATETYLTHGKVYYEVLIETIKGFPSFGWISKNFKVEIDHLFDCGVGFPGKDSHSHDGWAIDGLNQRAWPNKVKFGLPWKSGDIVTVAADIDKGLVTFGLNGNYGHPMGVAFQDIQRQALSPALSGSHGTIVSVRFSKHSMRYPPPSADYVSFEQAFQDTNSRMSGVNLGSSNNSGGGNQSFYGTGASNGSTKRHQRFRF